MPLPDSRQGQPSGDNAVVVTYGDYFTAVHDYLTQDNMAQPVQVARLVTGRSISISDIDHLDAHLIKHGAFYHPAKVDLALSDGTRPSFLLNVAASPAGRARLDAEAFYLDQLYRDYPRHFTPQIYHSGAGQCQAGDRLPIFAAQWLAGFHEVHRTGAIDGDAQWVVWDADEGSWYLTQAQTADFFRQAVCILTYFFDPHTLHVIGRWHHAAGDFVVGKQANGIDVDVRLITVRSYEPLVQLDDNEGLSLEIVLDALVVFFLRTSLWMRLDRLDGVGELVWADEKMLGPIWEGFVQGLQYMAEYHSFPSDFAHGVIHYIASHSQQELFDLGQALVQRLTNSAEAVLISRHLQSHTTALAAVCQL